MVFCSLQVYLTILFEVMVREKSVWGPSDFTFSISLVRKPITWAVKLTDLQRWRVQRLVWELRSGCKSLLQPQKLAPRLHCFDSLPRFHYGLTFLTIIFGLLIDVLDDLLQDCRVGKLVRGLGEANGLTWWFWLLISDPDEAWYLIWSFVVVFSFNLHSVASSLWCSLELVVCTSDSFNCPEASYLVSVVCHLTDTVSSSTCMWFGWNMISSFARIKKMLEVSNKGPKWKYQFVPSLYSRLSKFDLAINYLVTILFQEVGFWYLAACIFQLANLSHIIGSKDRMYMNSECSKIVHTYMNWLHLDLWVYYSTYCCPWLHLWHKIKFWCAHIFNFNDKRKILPPTCVGLTVVASCSWGNVDDLICKKRLAVIAIY